MDPARRHLGPSTAVAAVILAALTGRLDAQAPGPDVRYVDLVRRYVRGERAAAVSAVASFSDQELKDAFEAIQRLVRRAASCANCQEKAALDRISLPAALMVHADRHWLDHTGWRAAEHGIPQCRVGIHLEMAERLAALIAGQPEGASFASRFHLAMVARWHADMCLQEALRWARSGLKWFPRDPALLLARGAVDEAIGGTVFRRGAGLVAGLPPSRREQVMRQDLEGRLHLEQARQSFEEALAVDPRLHEARLRLGRVQWQLGQADRARAALETVIGEAPAVPTLYLAHLFLGRIHEDANRLDDAERHYRAALAAVPDAQVAAVALGHVLQVAGEAAEARSVLGTGIRAARRRDEPDPYWNYLLARPDAAEAAFEELHKETLR